MRRAVFILIAYLLAGAIITSGISWGCAYWGRFSGHWWSNEVWEQVGDDVRFARISDQPPIFMYVAWWSPREELRRVPSESPRGRPGDLLPRWVPAPHQPPESGGRIDHINATGWPWPLLYYHVHELRTGDWRASSPRRIAGGVRISNSPRAGGMQLQYFPLIPVWPWFYLSSAISAALLYGVMSLFRINLGLRRRLAGRCPKCAYDLRGDLASGCPECGWGRGGVMKCEVMK